MPIGREHTRRPLTGRCRNGKRSGEGGRWRAGRGERQEEPSDRNGRGRGDGAGQPRQIGGGRETVSQDRRAAALRLPAKHMVMRGGAGMVVGAGDVIEAGRDVDREDKIARDQPEAKGFDRDSK